MPMPTERENQLLHTLAEIDRFSANAQLLLTESGQTNKSVARLRQMAIELKETVQGALDQLDANS